MVVDTEVLDDAVIEACCQEIADRFTAQQKISSLRVGACPNLSALARRLFGSEADSERDLNDLVHFSIKFTELTLAEPRDRALLRAGQAFVFCARVPNEHDIFLIQRGNPGAKISSRDTKKVRDTWAFMNYKRALLGNPEDSYTAKSGQKMRSEFQKALVSAVSGALQSWDLFRQSARKFRTEQLASRLTARPDANENSNRRSVDMCEFVSETIPDGSLIPFGTSFMKSWTIRNIGNTPWINRAMKRITPQTPLFPHTAEFTPLATTLPGETVTISVEVISSRLAGFSELRFKMVDQDGEICWPVLYPYGLTMVIETRELIWTQRHPGPGALPWDD